MDKKSYHLTITLKSDLCAGSGYSYAGVVDTDVCYDKNGLPYIPAKRIKGCLRETAEMIGLEEGTMARLFNEGGSDRAQGVFIGNAYIKDYQELFQELDGLPKEYKQYVTPQSTLELFTTVKAQTKLLPSGVAKDNSLRFTRTVNHYSPLEEGQELCFYANVETSGLEDADIEALRDLARGLRKLGMNRNRGLGSVVCKLEDGRIRKFPDFGGTEPDFDPKEDYVLSYRVRNVAPLVITTARDDKTEKYITGQSVLGFFAGAYLEGGGDSESEEFERIFLKKGAIFSNLYPTDQEGRFYAPAPAYIKCLKKTRRYVNLSKEVPFRPQDCAALGLDETYASGNGNQPKKLTEKFVAGGRDQIALKEVETDIVYHHTRKSARQFSESGDLLYAFEAIREQQTFAGTITGKGRDIQILYDILMNNKGKLRFGRSKSSQYGTCVLEERPKVRKRESGVRKYPAHERILVVFKSDGIFMNERGYTVNCGEVREKIRSALKITEVPNGGNRYSELESKVLTGYYTKWNLKRPAVPAVKAGSTFEFLLGEELVIREQDLYVGERIGEGYGCLTVTANDGKNCAIEEEKKERVPAVNLQKTKDLCSRLLLKEAKDQLMQQAVNTKIHIPNPAALGRITLMLSDSINAYPEDPDKRYQNFCERVDSIKTKELKQRVEFLLDTMICGRDVREILCDDGVKRKEFRISRDKLQYLLNVDGMKEIGGLYQKIPETGKPDFQEEMKKLWSDYLMRILIQEKYNQKQRGTRDE